MSNNPPRLLVACFCAAWCRTCGDYKLVFEALKAQYSDLVEFVWVDIEDQSDLLETIDVENFPTLLISDTQQVYFWGAVLPFATTVTQLLDRVISGDRLTLVAPESLELNQRLHSSFLALPTLDPIASP